MSPKAYTGPERRSDPHLSDEQIEDIAERAAEKAVEKMTSGVYQAIGKSILDKALYLTGAIGLGVWFWMKKNGWVT